MKKFYFFLLLAGFLAAGCGSTAVMNSWKAPGETMSPGEYKKVLVVALIKDEKGRKGVEDELVKFNKTFHPSYPEFTTEQLLKDTSKVISMVKEKGYDAAIVMKLVTTKTKSTYVAGGVNPAYNQQIWYFNDYYKSSSYAKDMEYIIATNIYSLTRNKLIWSGVTSSTNPKKVEKLIKGIAKEVAWQVREDKLIVDK